MNNLNVQNNTVDYDEIIESYNKLTKEYANLEREYFVTLAKEQTYYESYVLLQYLYRVGLEDSSLLYEALDMQEEELNKSEEVIK